MRTAMYALGPFRLDAEAEILFRNGEPLPIGKRAVALLRVLVERAGVPVSKDVLLEAAWAGLVVDESNLPVQILAVRKVLSQEPGGQHWIETLPRRGYRFVGPVNKADVESITTTQSMRQAADASQSQHGAAHLPPTLRIEPERRQVTIAFCELICPAASAFDVEDLADVIGAYRRSVADIASRCNGSIGRHIGNVVVVHFGHPVAHEDDAEQAVQAGFRLCTAVKELTVGVGRALSVRVAITTGLVIVNDAANGGEPQGAGIIGEAPTAAGRLLGLAKPDTVLIDAATRRLIGNLFSCRDLGSVEPISMAMSTQVWQVLGPSAINNRFEALRGADPAPLVGRDEELEVLRRRWAQARTGEGRVVLVAGEPGIGKSRLARALLERLQAEPHVRLQYNCSPYRQDSALHPIISELLRVTGMEHEDTPEQKLDKLKATLAPTTRDHNEAVALLAPLLSIPLGPEYAPLDVSPQRRKELTVRVLLDQLKALADSQPVLMIVEDAHWIDPTSLEFLSLAIERIGTLSALLVITARPGFAPPWPSYAYVSTLTLNRLGRRQGEALVLRITRGKALPADVLNQIIAHTDGVPLFVEELTKTVLDSGLLEDVGDGYIMRGPLPALAIPSTLHASLLARLDRLAAVKDVAQTAAAIGREFPYELISAVAGLPQRDLQAALAELVAAELVFQRGVPPDAKYLFKHALVQDAAYASLVRSRRQQLHAKIAHALEAQFPDVVVTEPEMLAHHCTAAGLTEPAVLYWQRAGQLAVDRSAYSEATRHFNTGIELLAKLPDTPARTRQEIALHIALGAAQIVVKGHAAAEVEHTYLRARELCERIGANAELIPVFFGLWRCYIARPQLRQALELGQSLQDLARKADDAALGVIADYTVGLPRHFLGQFADARRSLERGVAHYASQMSQAPLFRIGQDPGVGCRSYGAMCLWVLGFPDQAVARGRDGLALALELMHPFSVAFARCVLACVAQNRRDVASVREQADAALALATEQKFPVYAGLATILRGWALAIEGKCGEGLVEIEKGMAAWQALGVGGWRPSFCIMLAEAFEVLGRAEEALQTLDEARSLTESTEERWWEAEIYRRRGVVFSKQSMRSQEEAETWLRRALDVARRQQGKSLELRAAVSLARLWRGQGKHVEARDLLVPIYGWFTEGFDTVDLKEARILLNELTSTAPQRR
jgi:DNA-binding winged helix-turn-helix (wHTH) protein/predicted ATPase